MPCSDVFTSPAKDEPSRNRSRGDHQASERHLSRKFLKRIYTVSSQLSLWLFYIILKNLIPTFMRIFQNDTLFTYSISNPRWMFIESVQTEVYFLNFFNAGDYFCGNIPSPFRPLWTFHSRSSSKVNRVNSPLPRIFHLVLSTSALSPGILNADSAIREKIKQDRMPRPISRVDPTGFQDRSWPSTFLSEKSNPTSIHTVT